MFTTQGKLKKFWFSEWRFKATFSLESAIDALFPYYTITIKDLKNDSRVIQDTRIKEIVFEAYVIWSATFDEITFKIDAETNIKLTDLVSIINEFWISLEKTEPPEEDEQ